tara:strand:- start:16 stop:579 length:564 start_codon:yes stop_codon:yes gene_type:complete
MNFKKIIVYDFDVLFNILEEIKQEFNFDVIRADKMVLDDLKKNLKFDYLIISKFKLDRFKNQIILSKVPLKIDKLIEQINLKFLKEKFNSQSNISIGSYKLNRNSREISKDGIKTDLTEREINLIFFLKTSEKAVKIEELQREVWEYGSELETHTVETHIYRLRKKIKEKFKDENFILSSKEGYLIN